MAQNDNLLYGMDKELAAKAAAKYDAGLEAQARQWIEMVTGERMGACELQLELKSGEMLCKLLNKISPGIIPKIQTSKMAFKQMENVDAYIKGCRALGVPDGGLFMIVDLFEGKDMNVVLQNIHSLGRVS